MKSAGNGDVLCGSLQMLHIQVLLVDPLCAGHMAQPGTNQHQGGVSIREAAHYPSTAANLPVQPLNDIVGADACPVFAGKIAVGKRFLNVILHFLGGLFQLYTTQLLHHSVGFLTGSFLALPGVDRQSLHSKCDTILYHTELYEYRHGKMLMHLRFIFETLSELNSPGEYMRYYRQLRELTTRQLAEKLNIVPATVLAYEQGRFPIPYEISIAAAEMLHISEELLFDDFCVFISAPYTELLHTVRKRYGLSQVDFAQKAGISPSIYTKWEAGNRRPSRKMYRQLVTTYPEINI